MITTGQLRIFATDFIKKLVRSDVVNSDDIRWLKSGNGVFPRKYVWAGEVNNSEFKETPYSPEDTFILFDILQGKNQAAERIGDIVYSQLPFTIIINVYGKAAEDELQHMLHSIHTYGVKLWLQSKKVSLVWEPEDFQILALTVTHDESSRLPAFISLIPSQPSRPTTTLMTGEPQFSQNPLFTVAPSVPTTE